MAVNAEQNAKKPLYQKVDKWLTEQGSSMNAFNMSESDIFYYLMLAEYPGLSEETAESFFNTARELLAG